MSDLSRLSEACKWSMRRMRYIKETRMKALRQYVGKHYSEDGAADKVPINMIYLHVNTLQRHLNSESPLVDVSTPYRDYFSVADDMELATNFVLEKSNAGRTYSKMGVDAMFGLTACKVGLKKGARAGDRGYGYPFIKHIPFQHLVLDMANAADEEELEFIGNRYRVPLMWAKDNLNFKKSARESLTPSDRRQRGEEGDVNPEEFSRGGGWNVEEYTDHVDLWDIWLPLERLVVTVSDENPEVALNIIEWEGPEHGPYHLHGFGDVPGNILPLAPTHISLDMHTLINQLFNKAGRQALDQKTLLGANMQSLDDADRIRDGQDGEVIPMTNPEGVKEYKFNGADQGTTGLVLYLRDLYSYCAGNLDLLGGLGAQSDTLGQDRLLAASSNQQVVDMQGKHAAMQAAVGKDVGWYIWSDPGLEMPLKKKIAGTNVEIPFMLTPDRLKGDYWSMGFTVDPYKLTRRSPAEKLELILKIMQSIAPIVQAGGVMPKGEELISLISKFAQIPEFGECWTFASGFQPNGGDPVAPIKQTGAEYTHRSVPSASRAGKERIMAASLMGAGQQPKETNSVVR